MLDDAALIKFYMKLSGRKREVVELVSDGYSNDAVAERLFITKETVADHLTEVFGLLSEYEALVGRKPNRQLLTRLFAPFFERHPSLRNESIQPNARL